MNKREFTVSGKTMIENELDAYWLGVEETEERIIEIINKLDLGFYDNDNSEYTVGDALDLIELIKGETNEHADI